MPRVVFTISYTIKPEAREEYLDLVRQMKQHFASIGKNNYSVFESKGKVNQFTEMFTSGSMEEYDSLEDNLDEETQEIISKIESLVVDGMKYHTLVETI